ncbi:type II CRISPR RNA-guided endonuclease Cas9 [Oceanivirga miroungae]|uniref:CRISPR-associated endonuclease Cas9 n=1 Tax=Oceanivirga miroungae TaxID=1130046 RepID=A0A6I8MCI5_9FUSO|nr:type II CRISPR RNA-guided endonuclease Cas9 [Oceanivirga miroungae]VWL85950.1 CRISPR-associated endonuclease Cas9 [Oceanivirga miroungae]
MIQKFKNDYFVGLDMGTNSVGWAVTDEDYKVLRFNKKDMWGSRLFDEASPANERRAFRSSRRALKRKKWRLDILKLFFKDELDKIDNTFLMRLDESNLYLEDKNSNIKFTLFNDKDFNDTDFYKKYKTIYHLRNELVNSKEKVDIRLVYLALHHIFKSRGHFLFENLGVDEIKDFDNLFNEYSSYINERFEKNISSDKKDELNEILCSKDTKRDKKNKIKELFFEDDFNTKIFSFVLGNSLKLDEIFNEESLKGEKIDNFNNYEETKRDEYFEKLGDDIALIDLCKKINDYIILNGILKNEKSISKGMVNLYNKHNEELNNLKYFVKKYDKSKYNEVFRKENSLYSNYINSTKFGGSKKVIKEIKSNKTEIELLIAYFKKLFKDIEDKISDNEKDMFNKLSISLEENQILAKLRTSNNSVVPYQLHKYELMMILENQSKYYEFLKENKDKIIKTFEFRIPYYVGPLNSKSKFAWIEKHKDEKITPWNFEEVVDIEKSAENFIERMINTGTYLKNEYVIPKNSLIYEEYSVLNELNKVKVDGVFINKELKNKIFNELFKTKTNVSITELVKFLKNRQYDVKKEDISGLSEAKFNSNYATYKKFKDIFGDDIEKDLYKEVIENIIKWKCLYGDDKKIFANKFKSVYTDLELSDETFKKILKLKFTGFGRLSKKFLTEIEIINKETGEIYKSVLQALRETNYNLMELLSSNFDLSDKLKVLDSSNIEMDYKELRKDENFKKIVDDLYVSPHVKRSIIQTIKILNELISVTKKDPKKIFVEVAREKQESNITEKRKEKIEKLYKDFKESKDNDLDLLKEELKGKDNNELKSKKIFLYFMQLGKCIYSGERIDLNDLLYNNKYDIDHIYPQSYTKDDSLDNMVLTKKVINNARKNTYPINYEVQAKMKDFWKLLKMKGFMSLEKYNRLVDTEEFSNSKIAGFIQRQLVSVRQSTKEVTNILKLLYPNTEIVYSKANNVSMFKAKYELIKSRDLNDLHHAKDAYLNIVVGNVLDNKFTKNYYKYVENSRYSKESEVFNFFRVFDHPLVVNNKNIWNTIEILDRVLETYDKNTANITNMLYEGKGKLFDTNMKKKGKTDSDFKVAIDVENTVENASKYGYYSSMKATYFVVLEVDAKKGKRERLIDRVLVMDRDKIKNSSDIEKYFEEKYKNPKFIAKIKKGQLIEYNGYPYRVTSYYSSDGRTVLENAKPLFLNNELTKIVINVSRLVEKNKKVKEGEELILSKLKRVNEDDPAETYEECVIRYNEEFIKLYDALLEKAKTKVYENYLLKDKIINVLGSQKEIFYKLSIEQKATVLKTIMVLFSKDSLRKTVEIKSHENFVIKKAEIVYKLKLDEFYVIDESITGLFTKKNKI